MSFFNCRAIGAIYGRLIGYLTCLIFEKLTLKDSEEEQWGWMDPGIFALLGSASFIAGTSRLPVTSVVMLIEMTNDINVSLLIMIVVMMSKFIGGMFTHPLYHSMCEFKCIPFLDSEIVVHHKGKR
jgi:chloride channel 7